MEPSKRVALMHGGIALTGLILLTVMYVRYLEPMLLTSLIIFTVSAIGGFVMFMGDITGRIIPRWLAIVQGGIAIAGLVVLLLAVSRMV